MLLRLFAVLGPAYMLSQFLRNSVAVLAPDLAAELELGGESLGALTGAFFLAFAAVQLPVGMALDRFGPRRVMAALMAVVAAGCLMFALSETAGTLLAARMLMGIGCAPLLMGALVVFARAFPDDRFASLSALQLAVGNTGILLATTPLAAAAEAAGWRASILAAGGLAGLFALLIWRRLPERIGGRPLSSGHAEGVLKSLRGVALVARDRRLWPLMPLMFCGYGVIASVTALWGGPYLADVHGLDAVGRGNVLFLMAAGSVAGPLLWGPLDRRFNTRKWLVLPGCSLVISAFAALALPARPPLWAVAALLASASLCSGYFTLTMAHARALFPEHAIGRGMTVMNMLIMGGVGVLQPVSGAVASWFASPDTGALPLEAYRAVFAFLAACLAAALAIYMTAPDRPPRPEPEAV